MTKFLWRLRSVVPYLRCTFYEKENQKYLVLYRICFGKTLWSRHFLIKDMILNKGIRNSKYDSKLDALISSSNK